MKLKRIEASHLQKFKNQAKLSKTFGKASLKVYNAIPKDDWGTLEEVIKKSGMDEQTVMKIVEFMDKEGMLELVQEEAGEIEKAAVGEVSGAVEPEKEEVKPIIAEEIPSEEVKPEFEVEEEEKKPGAVEEGEEIKFEAEEEEEIKPEISIEEAPEEAVSAAPEEKEEIPESYTEEEADIYRNFGEVGVSIYKAFKEGKSAADIIREEGLSEGELKQITDFLESRGYLTPVEEEIKEEKEEEERFGPLSSDIEEAISAAEVPDEEAIFEYKLKKLSFFERIKAKFSVVLKFKRYGREVFDYLSDGEWHDILEIVKKLRISVKLVGQILSFLESSNYVEKRKLGRQDIRKKYGYDSLAVYRKYGRSGVLMYDLIGKDLSLKEIAKLAGIEDNKELAYEIFSFIHRLLGIEIPLDKSMIMRQLE